MNKIKKSVQSEILVFEGAGSKEQFKVKIILKNKKYYLFVIDSKYAKVGKKVMESLSLNLVTEKFHRIVYMYTNKLNETNIKKENNKIIKTKAKEEALIELKPLKIIDDSKINKVIEED